MSSQELNYLDSSSDESSDSSEDTDSEEIVVDISSSGYESLDNNHLSGVLSQIQDDGPAYEDSIDLEDPSDHVEKSSVESTLPDNQNNPVPKDNKPPAKSQQINSAAKKILVQLNGYADLIQLVLIIIIAAASGFMFFNLDSRANELEQTMLKYDEGMQESITARSDDIEPKVIEINKILTSVQENLALVVANYVGLDKKYEAAIKDTVAVNENDAKGIKGNLNALENDVMTLRSELNSMREVFESATKNRVGSEINVVNKTTNKAVRKGLVVNLASLTNLEKVDDLINKIHKTGLSPAVENAVVNGRQVYRISVSGFVDVKAANLFIKKAEKQYGTTGARIRKS